MALFVKFWGTRGSIPTPGAGTAKYGGNTSCVEIRTEDTLVICDGGTGLRELGLDLLRRYGNAPITAHLFFSHAHWDHIQGFPFFTPAFSPRNTFHVYGSTADDKSMYGLLSGQMSSDYFPVSFKDLGARILLGELVEGLDLGSIQVSWLRQRHPGSSLGFAFVHGGRKIVYATDNELDLLITNQDEVEADLNAIRRFPQDQLDFARDADLLIADGQYLDHEYAQKRFWGHPRVGTVVDFAAQAGVRQLAITHHEPMHNDREVDAKIVYCQQRAARHAHEPVVFGAREGFELKIG